MDILVPTLIIFTIAVVIMSIGVLFRRKPLQGSCGGIAAISGDCDFCSLKDKCVAEGTPQCDEHKDCPPDHSHS